jgi:hypothetical protein
MPTPRARMPMDCARRSPSSPSRYWQEFFLLAAFERRALFLLGQSLQGLESGSHSSRTMTIFSARELQPFEHPRRRTQGTCGGYCRVHRRQASSWPSVRTVCAFRRLCLVFSSKGFHRLFRPASRSRGIARWLKSSGKSLLHAPQLLERGSQSLQLCDSAKICGQLQRETQLLFRGPRARYRGCPSSGDAVERQARRIP